MKGHIDDIAEDKAVLGDSLEVALEQGEKHEIFATKCMEVRVIAIQRISMESMYTLCIKQASIPC